MKSPIIALRQRKYELVNKQRELLDLAKAQNRDLTLDEQALYQRNISQLSEYEAKLIEAEQALEAERRMPALPDENAAFVRLTGLDNRNAGFTDVHKQKSGPGKKYADLFGPHFDTGGFASLNDFFKSVHVSSQVFDPRLLASATEKVPSDGGFLVPSEYSRQILDQALEDQVVMPRAQVWPMASDTRKVPAIDDTDHSSGVLFGGVTASWADELGALADQKVKLRMVELHASKMGMISQCSNELLEDSDFDSVLGNKLQAGAAWHLDDAFINGNGSGRPLGIMNSLALVTVNKESSQPADEVVYENITKMYAAMAPGCRRRAVWVFNDGLIPSLYKMQNRVTNLAGSEVVGGSAVPVFSVDSQGNGTLLTRPCLFSEHLSAPGDLGDAMFCDFSQYVIGIRRQVTIERSAHAGFATDSVYYRLTVRVDGQPTWRKPLTPEHGTAQSPFVTLQAR